MSAGILVMTILAILLFCGLLHRVLDRLCMTNQQAWAVIIAMIIGTMLPNITIGSISVGWGGAIIPIAICIRVFRHIDTNLEKHRVVIGSIASAAAVFLLSVLFPSEAEQMKFDPLWLYGIFGGAIACLFGRSQRAAFICGVLGILIADVINYFVIFVKGYQAQLVLGGAGIADATVIGGIISVLFCEIWGKLTERMIRRHRGGQ